MKKKLKKVKKEVKKNNKKELEQVKYFLKQLDEKSLKLLKKLKEEEILELGKYLVISKLKLMSLDFEHKLIELERNKKILEDESLEISYLKSKISKIPLKIKLFETDFRREEFKKINKYFKNIEKELKNV